MTEQDLKDNKYVSYVSCKGITMHKNFIGRPVLRLDRGYGEYGIVTGFNQNLIFVHFANSPKPLRLHPSDLYFPVVDLRKTLV